MCTPRAVRRFGRHTRTRLWPEFVSRRRRTCPARPSERQALESVRYPASSGRDNRKTQKAHHPGNQEASRARVA
jgi:hypothetical protein